MTESRRSVITSLHGPRPKKGSIIIQNDHTSFRQLRVEIIDSASNGIMEIKVNVHKRIDFFWEARQGIGNPALVVFNRTKFREGSPNRVLPAIKEARRSNVFPSK